MKSLLTFVTRRPIRVSFRAAAVPAAALLLGAYLSAGRAGAAHIPANKVAATGSKEIHFVVASTFGGVVAVSQEQVLLSTTMRTSAPTDLVLSVSADCWVENSSYIGDEGMTHSFGSLDVWIEIDGRAVGVNNVVTSTTTAAPADQGRVSFCHSAKSDSVFLANGIDRRSLTRGTASAFNWVAPNVGAGVHQVVVKGRLSAEAESTPVDWAEMFAMVRQRTLVVDPVKMANDDSI